MKQLTVNDLYKECERVIKMGYGNKKLIVADDNEGNGYHGLFFGLTLTADKEDWFDTSLISDSLETDPNKLVIVG